MPRPSGRPSAPKMVEPYNTGGPQPAPITVAPNQGYGDRQAQVESQRVVPMAGSGPQPPAAGVPSPTTGGAGPGLTLDAVLSGAQGMPDPGDGLLAGDTTRPWEPETAGADFGPGGGPEMLNLPMSTMKPRASDTLAMFADITGSTALADLAERARMRGQ